jgi:hypothetical protein
MIELGRLYRLGPLYWRYSITQGFWSPPVLHYELQLNLRWVAVTVVISRYLR